jgi:hypothetical protein
MPTLMVPAANGTSGLPFAILSVPALPKQPLGRALAGCCRQGYSKLKPTHYSPGMTQDMIETQDHLNARMLFVPRV